MFRKAFKLEAFFAVCYYCLPVQLKHVSISILWFHSLTQSFRFPKLKIKNKNVGFLTVPEDQLLTI